MYWIGLVKQSNLPTLLYNKAVDMLFIGDIPNIYGVDVCFKQSCGWSEGCQFLRVSVQCLFVSYNIYSRSKTMKTFVDISGNIIKPV